VGVKHGPSHQGKNIGLTFYEDGMLRISDSKREEMER
jgi:hypothetical protein